jgi:hypothetical protein
LTADVCAIASRACFLRLVCISLPLVSIGAAAAAIGFDAWGWGESNVKKKRKEILFLNNLNGKHQIIIPLKSLELTKTMADEKTQPNDDLLRDHVQIVPAMNAGASFSGQTMHYGDIILHGKAANVFRDFIVRYCFGNKCTLSQVKGLLETIDGFEAATTPLTEAENSLLVSPSDHYKQQKPSTSTAAKRKRAPDADKDSASSKRSRSDQQKTTTTEVNDFKCDILDCTGFAICCSVCNMAMCELHCVIYRKRNRMCINCFEKEIPKSNQYCQSCEHDSSEGKCGDPFEWQECSRCDRIHCWKHAFDRRDLSGDSICFFCRDRKDCQIDGTCFACGEAAVDAHECCNVQMCSKCSTEHAKHCDEKKTNDQCSHCERDETDGVWRCPLKDV